MLKMSHWRLSTLLLSASLLLATASSALASGSALTGSVSGSYDYIGGDAAEQGIKVAMKVPMLSSAERIINPGSANLRTPVTLLDDLTESALHLNNNKHQQFQPPTSGQTAGTTVKTFVPNFFDYRPSRTAAQVFLSKDTNSSLPYREQSEIDHIEGADRNQLSIIILATMMQLAKGLGDSNQTSAGITIEKGRGKLTELLGQGQADWVYERMSSWAEQVRKQISAEQIGASVDEPIELEHQVTGLAQKAVASDAQIANLKATMAVYDRAPGYLDRGLSAAGLTPTLIGPAAKLAQYAVECGSGGSRGKRLSDVLSIGVTIQERVTTLTRQSEIAVNNLERAHLSKNPVLYAFSKDLIGKLGGTR
jgi:hypothetical protein